jgi:hypothetical protein
VNQESNFHIANSTSKSTTITKNRSEYIVTQWKYGYGINTAKSVAYNIKNISCVMNYVFLKILVHFSQI